METLFEKFCVRPWTAHPGISVNGFWGGNCERITLMSRFLTPMLQTIVLQPLRGIYRRLENAKKHTYEARIHEVKNATFTLLVFSATGGMADEACAFYILCYVISGLKQMLL